jgi:hypothetical protein
VSQHLFITLLKESHNSLDERVMIFLADPTNTRRRALTDIAQEALAFGSLRLLEIGNATTSNRKGSLDHVKGASKRPSMGVRTESFESISSLRACDEDPRIFIPDAEREIGI